MSMQKRVVGFWFVHNKITLYQYELRTYEAACGKRILLFDEKGNTHQIIFLGQPTITNFKNTNVGTKDKPRIKLYMEPQVFPEIIDMLRNEKPVYISYKEWNQSGYICTNVEPIGEEET